MAQYKDGTASVTNGSPVVTGDTGLWITNGVLAGNIFTVVGDNAWYEIASVDSETQITLSANYAGTTQSGASYTIAKDFTANYNIPYPNKGDIETASLLKRSLQEIDSAMADLTAGSLTGVLNLTSGSAASPSLYFNGDDNTGLYYYGADSIGLSIGGVRQYRFMSNQLNLYTETQSPVANFQYAGSTNYPGVFRGYSTGGTIGSPTATPSGRIMARFEGAGYGTGYVAGGRMEVVSEEIFTASSGASYLRFLTTPTGTTTPAERMKISASGNVIVGTAALATSATSGFFWLPSCAGAPSGAPTAPYTNAAACVVDTTNSRLYVRVGTTWKYVALT